MKKAPVSGNFASQSGGLNVLRRHLLLWGGVLHIRIHMRLEALELPVHEALEDLLLLKACLAAMRVRLELKYSDTQPRWPAGDPRGGQWRPKEGGDGENAADEQGSLSDGSDLFGEAPDGTPIELVGGIPEDKLNWTTQQFMSAYCRADIRRVMPGEFLNMKIEDVIARAKQGEAAANRCWKLLRQDRFRK